MGNVTTTDLTAIDNSSTVNSINNNIHLLRDEFDKVVYKDGREELTGNLDANSKRIINLPDAVSSTEPITLNQLEEAVMASANGDLLAEVALRIAGDGARPTTTLLSGVSGAALVGFSHAQSYAAGSIGAKAKYDINVKDAPYNAVGNGVTDDSAAILATAVGARTALTDGTGRTLTGEIRLAPGRYLIDEIIELAPAGGLTGLIVTGSGSGCTEIIYSGASATLKATSSRAITWRDLSFVSSGVDSDQVAFTINQTGNPLRSWRFERCEFQAFYKCFAVTGTSMDSEFYFLDCKFLQCYELVNNDNDQAVNWNFVNCDWENNELTTVKNKNLSTILHLKKGTFVKWTGGSLIFHGMMAYYDLTASGVFQRTSHKVIFDGVRIELVDDGAAGHAPLIDRVSTGYTNGSNSPTTTITNFTIINRGSIPTTVTYAKVWASCSLRMTDGEAEGGKVVGILDAVTASSNANVVITAKGITYQEDISARVNTHDQHNVTIVPDNSSNGTQPHVDLRLGSLTVPSTAYAKRLYVRGPTGSIPQGGTTVNLPAMLDHTFFVKLFCYRSTVAGQSLTVLLRDQADTTTYGTLTIGVGVSNMEAFICEEMGADIPSGTALMLKFTGTPEVVKGVVGFEYL